MTTQSTALVPVSDGLDYIPRPIVSLAQLSQIRQERLSFVQSQLRTGVDYYKIEGGEKEGLAKAGAENLCDIFGFACGEPEILNCVEDWDRPFFRYLVRTPIVNKRSGKTEGYGLGECNSHESKYRWRWVTEQEVPKGMDKSLLQSRNATLTEFAFAVEKAETGGKYGKPATYWKQFTDAIEAGTAKKIRKATRGGKEMDALQIGGTVYRIPNDDAASLVNTIVKMAKKRSFVDAVLTSTHMSDRFTQFDDDEDTGHSNIVIDVTPEPPKQETHNAASTVQPEPVNGGPSADEAQSVAVSEWVADIKACETSDKLKALWHTLQVPNVWSCFTPVNKDILTNAKNARKAELERKAELDK